jgi:hypothetical protein
MSRMTNNSIELYSRNENPFEISWEDWAAKWWNWIFSIPEPNNPIDSTKPSVMAQEHSASDKAVFLAGARNGDANRTISSMPANKGCFFPVAVCECSCAEFPNYDNEQLKKCARDGNKVSHMEVNIDGQVLPMEELKKYFVETKWFDLQNIVNGNIFSAQPGKSNAYSVGYWLFLKPLKSGSHFDLSINQSTEDDEFSKTFNCAYSVKYNISVV